MKGRIFKSNTDGKEVVLRFNVPSQKVLTKSDFVYRQTFSTAIRAGVLTSAEANKILKERSIWDDSKELEAAKLREDIRKSEEALKDPGLSNPDGKELCDKLRKLRGDLNDLTALYTSVSDNTAEQVAAEARNKFMASECVVYNDSGERVFKSAEEFDARLDERITSDSYREALISNYERVLGIEVPDGLASELPESKWLADRGLVGTPKAEEAPAEAEDEKKKRTRKPKAV
jgi:hypothetical protein